VRRQRRAHRNIPVIAFSTDASVAARGVYLLSFLPESDVKRIVDYAASRGKRSFAALLPDNAYGGVVEAAFQQEVARRGGRMLAIEKYPADPARMAEAARRVAQQSGSIDNILIADGADACRRSCRRSTPRASTQARAVARHRIVDDPRIFQTPSLEGGWFAAPETTGFRNFAGRYRARYGNDPVRTATLAYDAVALVAALVKTQGQQRFSEQILTNSSGFAGIDASSVSARTAPANAGCRCCASRLVAGQPSARAEVVHAGHLILSRQIRHDCVEQRKSAFVTPGGRLASSRPRRRRAEMKSAPGRDRARKSR